MTANDYNKRGHAYNKKKKYDLAIVECTKAINLDPTHTEAYNNLGFAYAKLGKHSKAIRNYNYAILFNPRNASTYYNNRGCSWTKKGNYCRAIRDYNQSLELNPEFARAKRNLEKTLTRIKQEDDLSGIEKLILFRAIIKLPNDKKIPLLEQCLDKETPFGKRMSKFEKEIFAHLKKLGHTVIFSSTISLTSNSFFKAEKVDLNKYNPHNDLMSNRLDDKYDEHNHGFEL